MPLATECRCGHTLNWHHLGLKARPCTLTACDCEGFKKPLGDAAQPVHKWKRCDQCRHPEHPSACTVCRCLAVTSLESITDTCRSAGGCPEHPKSEDCAHAGARVSGGDIFPARTHFQCDDCGAKWTRNWSRGGKKTEGAPEPSQPCDCGHATPHLPQDCGGEAEPFMGQPEPMEPEPPLTPEEEEEVAAKYEAAGAEHLPPPEGPEYTPCVCGHIEPEHTVTGDQICMIDGCECIAYRTKPGFETEAPSDEPGPEHVCETYYCPTSGEVESACHGGFDVCCEAPERHVPEQTPKPPQPKRRPPYAVAYSVSGHLYEVALPGDAAVQAIDGALIITHRLGPVAGICQIAPIVNEESA